jgi:hypothetical protein
VHFVALATPAAIVATLCTHTVRFVALARRRSIVATKCTRPSAPQPPYPAVLTFAGTWRHAHSRPTRLRPIIGAISDGIAER